MSRFTRRLRWLVLATLAGAFVVWALFADEIRDRWDDVANLPTRVATRWVPPDPSQERQLKRRERLAVEELQGRLDGRIVWSSNRSGNHELYLLDVPSGTVRQLTDDPHVDFSSRFSPDGEWIVFARSQREWVSFRETESWDLWLMRADGSEARRIVRGGYHPTWGPGGESVVFQRGVQVLELELESDETRVLFDGDEAFPGHAIGDAALHPDGELLTLSVLRHGAVVGRPGGDSWRRLTDKQVCQTRWMPGSRDIVWMDPKGNGGTRVVRAAASGDGESVLMDLPGERSHEYFPNLSEDGRWLVWGASVEGHEHDRADYEIYVWEVGTPWEDAVRLTWYTGNDQWPDIHVNRR